MIGGLRSKFASLVAVAGLSAMACMPDLGQLRGFRLGRGPGIATSAPGMKRKPKRDSERQMRAVLKRRRKDAKRARDAQRCALGQRCIGYVMPGPSPFNRVVDHGC